jgi:hypothetical protein
MLSMCPCDVYENYSGRKQFSIWLHILLSWKERQKEMARGDESCHSELRSKETMW